MLGKTHDDYSQKNTLENKTPVLYISDRERNTQAPNISQRENSKRRKAWTRISNHSTKHKLQNQSWKKCRKEIPSNKEDRTRDSKNIETAICMATVCIEGVL